MCVWVCGKLCASGCARSSVCSASPARVDKAEGGDGCGNENVRPTERVFLKSFCNTGLHGHLCIATACVCARCLLLNLHFWALCILQMFWSPAAVAAGLQPGQGDPAAQELPCIAFPALLVSSLLLFLTSGPGTPAGRRS